MRGSRRWIRSKGNLEFLYRSHWPYSYEKLADPEEAGGGGRSDGSRLDQSFFTGFGA